MLIAHYNLKGFSLCSMQAENNRCDYPHSLCCVMTSAWEKAKDVLIYLFTVMRAPKLTQFHIGVSIPFQFGGPCQFEVRPRIMRSIYIDKKCLHRGLQRPLIKDGFHSLFDYLTVHEI